VDESLGDCHSRTEFLLHEIGHFGKMYLVDFEHHGHFVCHIVQFLVYGLEMLFMEACDVDQMINTLVVVDNLQF